MAKLGLVINPVAGMGGAVGLKGTDTKATLKKAERKGARPVSPERAKEFLEAMVETDAKLEFVVAAGTMGKTITDNLGISSKPIGRVRVETTRNDTIRIARQMLREKPDIIVFVGGDGTARDILESIGDKTVVLGIPAGVKVFSSVFSINPRIAAETIKAFLRGELDTRKGEVLDVNERLYRDGRLAISLEGYLVTPDAVGQMQNSKMPSPETEASEMDEIADYVEQELIHLDDIYILGPGITLDRIARKMGLDRKTLLGVDVVKGDGTVVALDASETQILKAIQEGRIHIILSPIGGQGFLLGRGNQQISPKVIRKVGIDNLIVVATKNKIGQIWPRRLLVDTGDREMDEMLHGYRRVVIGYREEMMLKTE